MWSFAAKVPAIQNPRNANSAIFVLALACTAFVYLPGLPGPFVFDDAPNLLKNPYVQPFVLRWESLRDAAMSLESGGLRRPLASISFALNFYFAGGFDPVAFKLTNLVIHGINGWLVFLLCRRIASRLFSQSKGSNGVAVARYLPAVVSAVWLLHPLQLTSVLYVVQRMNSLAALFMFAGLLIFIAGRTRLQEGRGGGLFLMYGGIMAGSVLGVLCKENAALLPLLAGVLELSCFSAFAAGVAQRRQLRMFYWIVLVIPYLSGLAFLATHPDYVMNTYQSRAFTLGERLLTQPRVLFFYLGLLFFPTRHQLGLFHDEFLLSTGLFDPSTTVIAIVAWAGIVIACVRYWRRCPVLIFSVGWFLAGHAMESGFFGLEMVYEHRNYLPGFGPMFGMSALMLWVFGRIRISNIVAYGSIGLVVITLGFVTHSRAYSWSSQEVLMETLLRHQPDSPRSHINAAGYIFITRGDIQKVFYHHQQSARLNPMSIGGLLEMARIADTMVIDEALESDPDGKDRALSNLFDLELIPSRSQRQRILMLTKQEIERRLRDLPVDGNTLTAFSILQLCIYDDVPSCTHLAENVARWLDVALANPRIVPQFRPSLLLYAAKVNSWLGNVPKALVYANFAVEESGGKRQFLLELGELYLTLGDHAQGLSIVDRLKSQANVMGFRAADVSFLEMRLNSEMVKRRAEKESLKDPGN